MECRLQDVRPALAFLCYLAQPLPLTTYSEDPLQVIREFITQFDRTVKILGMWQTRERGWHLHPDTTRHMKVYAAAMQVASCGLHLVDCVIVRLGTGKDSLEGVPDTLTGHLHWWMPERPNHVFTYEAPGTQRISFRLLFGNMGAATLDPVPHSRHGGY